jgi:hypothetical protein
MPHTARLAWLFAANINGEILMTKLLDQLTFQHLVLATAAQNPANPARSHINP